MALEELILVRNIISLEWGYRSKTLKTSVCKTHTERCNKTV